MATARYAQGEQVYLGEDPERALLLQGLLDGTVHRLVYRVVVLKWCIATALDGKQPESLSIKPATRETLDKVSSNSVASMSICFLMDYCLPSTAPQVIEYLDHHRDEDLSLDPTNHPQLQPSAWDREFINVDTKLLFDIIQVANYLNMKPLLYAPLPVSRFSFPFALTYRLTEIWEQLRCLI